MKTKVKFLKAIYSPNECDEQPFTEIIAYFPYEDYGQDNLKTCYSHTGQHSAICKEFANECAEATEKEYRDLKVELERLGYCLSVI